jgi:hypothetical protein
MELLRAEIFMAEVSCGGIIGGEWEEHEGFLRSMNETSQRCEASGRVESLCLGGGGCGEWAGSASIIFERPPGGLLVGRGDLEPL